MSRTLVALLVAGVGNAACSGGDLFVGEEEDGDAEEAAVEDDYLTRCKAATDAACQKGFDCDNFFVTSQFNSVLHCQNNVDQDYRASIDELTTAQLADCADVCDVMLADVQALDCEGFGEAIFNQYRCGN